MTQADVPAATAVVHLIALGGTIASIPNRSSAGAVPRLSAEDLTSAVPGLMEVAQLHTETLMGKASPELTFADVATVVSRARVLVRAGDAAGVVVTQGTDTMEETAFVADLLWDEASPLIFTGAMRTPTMAGADGPANLKGAVLTCVAAQAASRGVLVVMHDEIHQAKRVQKVHRSSTAAFSSAPFGAEGHLIEDRIRFFGPAPARRALAQPLSWERRVELVVATLDMRVAQFDALDGEDVAGMVVAGFGGGHVPSACVPAIERLLTRMPVVLASRVPQGSVLTHTYGFPGSEVDLLDRGVVSAGSLSALKARALLTVIVNQGRDRMGVEDEFRTYVEGVERADS